MSAPCALLGPGWGEGGVGEWAQLPPCVRPGRSWRWRPRSASLQALRPHLCAALCPRASVSPPALHPRSPGSLHLCVLNPCVCVPAALGPFQPCVPAAPALDLCSTGSLSPLHLHIPAFLGPRASMSPPALQPRIPASLCPESLHPIHPCASVPASLGPFQPCVPASLSPLHLHVSASLGPFQP